MRKKTIIIVGGGVAGMSAAHELLERTGKGVEFDVHIFERSPTAVGGKARSIPVAGTGREGRADLPGEHGFRFFPGFYKHLPNTMKGIPRPGGRTVFDDLVDAPRLELARMNRPRIVLDTQLPRNAADVNLALTNVLGALFGKDDLEIPAGDLAFFVARIWQVLTSCDARRVAEYETTTWWDFLEADRRSQGYRDLLASGLSRSLLANDPRHASARTVGNTDVQVLLGLFKAKANDRVLDGPTTETWLQPWLEHLRSRRLDASFRYHFGARATAIHVAAGAISGVTISEGGSQRKVTGDYYIFASPVERMAELIDASAQSANLVALDPALSGILKLRKNVAWMNGIQFFLYRDDRIIKGHCLFVDSPWSLTAISQSQFWSQVNLADRGDGTVRGIVSVCISDWDTPGIVYKKSARDLTHRQIAREVWVQLKTSLNVGGAVVLRDEDLHSSFLDPDIRDDPRARAQFYEDMEPLLVNRVNTWESRPRAKTAISNMFLASDYVQTYTDVACMEAANEAARRAVNAILEVSGSKAEQCRLWPLHEPDVLAPLRAADLVKYHLGLPWSVVGTMISKLTAGPAAATTQGAALYIERGGEQCHVQPYACNQTRMFGFFVRGSVEAIQKNVVDKCLNACTDALKFRALSDLILITFTDAHKCVSMLPPDSQMGWTSETSCVMWTPVVSVKTELGVQVAQKVYFFVPYIIVDNPWSLAAGREVYGFPKAFGSIQMPAPEADPASFTAETLVLPHFGANEQAVKETVLTVRRIQEGSGTLAEWRDVDDALKALASLWTGGKPLIVPGLGLGVELMDILGKQALPSVFLKQFRDAADGTRAAFQALVEVDSTVTAFRSGRIEPGSFELVATNFDSHPIASDLGFSADPVPVEFAFSVDIDFSTGPGTELWRAT